MIQSKMVLSQNDGEYKQLGQTVKYKTLVSLV